MIVYASQDDGTLYLESEIDYYPEGFTKYEIPNKFELTAEQCCGSYGTIVEILSKAGKIKKVE